MHKHKHKGERRYFGRRSKAERHTIRLEHVKDRFPRSEHDDMDLVIELRHKYPPPYVDSRTGHNPVNLALANLMDASTEKLRGMCRNHGLSDKGKRGDFITRLYLHHRAEVLGLHDGANIGYGEGYELVSPPGIACIARYKKPKIERFPRETLRFPRHPRFPRLKARFSRTGETTKSPLECPDLLTVRGQEIAGPEILEMVFGKT